MTRSDPSAQNALPAETSATAPAPAAEPRILFAITAEQFIAEYEELAYFRRQDTPNHPPEFWPPWADITPERRESLLQQAAALLEARLQTRRWLLLEDLVYTLVDPESPQESPPQSAAARRGANPPARPSNQEEPPAAENDNPQLSPGK